MPSLEPDHPPILDSPYVEAADFCEFNFWFPTGKDWGLVFCVELEKEPPSKKWTSVGAKYDEGEEEKRAKYARGVLKENSIFKIARPANVETVVTAMGLVISMETKETGVLYYCGKERYYSVAQPMANDNPELLVALKTFGREILEKDLKTDELKKTVLEGIVLHPKHSEWWTLWSLPNRTDVRWQYYQKGALIEPQKKWFEYVTDVASSKLTYTLKSHQEKAREGILKSLFDLLYSTKTKDILGLE
jgi:hypothetical protein